MKLKKNILKITEASLVQPSELMTQIMRLDHCIKGKPKKNNNVKFSTNQNNWG
jgi:hypothetical protein